jgi:sigma-B regulation protein RsbU (phosphoserine phosphatase)
MPAAAAPPLGAMPDIQFTNSTMQLPSNARLLLYTDGVTEAQNSDGLLFGSRTLLNMAKNMRCHTAEKCVRDIRSSLADFSIGTEQYDDITMLCIANSHAPAKPQTLSITVVNHRDEYQRLTAWLQEAAKLMHWNNKTLNTINLALEEWFVNIISYAFSDDYIHEIEVELRQTDNTVVISVTDDGIPFDPTVKPPNDIDAPLEERSIGGLGIHFIRNTMDKFEYQRKNNKNIITIHKVIDDEA